MVMVFARANGAMADPVTRLGGNNPKSPIAEAVAVPLAGYTMYFISGTPAGAANPNAPAGSPERMGDTATQTDSSLDRLGKTRNNAEFLLKMNSL